MIAMRDKGHLDQGKHNDESEVMQNQEQVQAELVEKRQEKIFMTIREVVALLISNESIESVSQKLEMRASILKAKFL